MKNRIFVSGACVTLLCSSVVHAQSASSAFITGKDYRAMSADQRLSYAAGAADMMARMCQIVASGNADFCNRVARCTTNMTSAQVRDFVDHYMRDGANDQYGMASNFRAAMNVNCPQ